MTTALDVPRALALLEESVAAGEACERLWPNNEAYRARTRERTALFRAIAARIANPTPHTQRWSVEDVGHGMVRICRGTHDKALGCQWEYYTKSDGEAEARRRHGAPG